MHQERTWDHYMLWMLLSSKHMLWMLGLHHWLVLECFELFLPLLVYDWTDFNLLLKVS
jgi:hypothetical protein